jgi:isoleucyl-tRNA synthetase
MTAVLQVVRLGRAARSEANLKVRQPLPAVLVHTADPRDAEAVVRLKDQILDELNVKDVRALEELSDVVAWEVKPNLPVLGPKFGKRLGAIRKALGAMDASAVAMQANAGKPISLGTIDGDEVVLEPSDVLVSLTKREGYAAAQGEGATVALDTELTPELIREGMARDFIRGVQDARKRLNLRIEQTIQLSWSADGEAAEAIIANDDFIRREVLATTSDRAEAVDGDSFDVKVGDEVSKVSITAA